MATTPDPLYRFGRSSTRGMILGFSAPRVAAIAVAAAVAVMGLFTANAAGFALTSVLWLPLTASAFIRIGGRPAVEWAGTFAHFRGRSTVGQTDYLARQPLSPRPAGSLALPGDAAPLRLHVDPNTGAAMVHDPYRQTLSATVSVSHPAFVLLDSDDRAQRVARWGRVYASLAQSGTTAAIQVLEATVPDPATGQAEWYDEHGVHDGSWCDQQYTQLLDQVRLAAGTHRSTITLTLDMRAAARAIKAAGRGIDGAAAVLRADMTNLADAIRQAGLRVVRWLGEAELAALIRGAYDPAVIIDPKSHPGANTTNAGPLAMSEHWDCLRHDSAWSSVLWISEWPRIDVPADFLHSIVFAPDVRRTLSIIARPLPTGEALRQLRREKTDAVADMAQKQKVGQLADLADAQEYEDLVARERSVVAGHTDVEFSGFVTVTAGTKESLEAARSAITRAATQAACEVRTLYGRQAQGFAVAALPLGRRAF